MWVCPVRSHHCQTQSLVPYTPHSLSRFLFVSSSCVPSVHLFPLPLLAPCSFITSVCRVLPHLVYTNILLLSATHIFIFDIPKKQMVLPSSLFSSHSLRSPPPFLLSCVSFHPAGVSLILTGSPPVYSVSLLPLLKTWINFSISLGQWNGFIFTCCSY